MCNFKRNKMKKLFLICAFIVSACCNMSQTSEQTVEPEKEECNLWIVEKKTTGMFTYAASNYLEISNVETKRLHTIKVGEYTYNNTQPGDTLVYNLKR